MTWIIASIPFWILGLGMMFVSLAGLRLCLKTDKTAKDIMETLLGFTVLIIGSGISLLIAAKIAS